MSSTLLAVHPALATVMVVLALGVGVAAALVVVKLLGQARRLAAHRDAEQLLEQARREAEGIRQQGQIDAKAEAIRMREEFETESTKTRQELRESERRLTKREDNLDRKLEMLTVKERALEVRGQQVKETEAAVAGKETQVDELLAEQKKNLLRISGLNEQQGKEMLLQRLEEEVKHECSGLIERLVTEAKESARDQSRMIVLEAIQRYAAEHTCDSTVSTVEIASDDMKGRVIGREGRNIRALEVATGVELIVDDTPGAIILSSFDPYRREIARQAIERLVADGRIHPARIEEVVDKVKAELEESVLKDGEASAFELGLYELHPEILRLMGKLKFRTSYGQNVLSHSMEVAFVAGIMSRELGLDAHVTTRAAFLHDIGKAIDRDLQGTHLELGVEFLRRHGENEAVIGAVAAHHMDIDWPSVEAMIVQSADAISAARPGARRDILETYVKRLEKLEGIADSFKGVAKSFALQAGREIRIMVESERISDEEAVWLSKDIARRIENELEYPGQIKVTVIRETRAVDYAR